MKPAKVLILGAVFFCLLPAYPVTPAQQSSPPEEEREEANTQPASRPAPQRQGAARGGEASPAERGLLVRQNYYLQIPGIDLSTLTPGQKERYLERVNTEYCNCGCPKDTVARCMVNDRNCTIVRGLAHRILSEVKAGL